jgi:hypothetical protein
MIPLEFETVQCQRDLRGRFNDVSRVNARPLAHHNGPNTLSHVFAPQADQLNIERI